MGNCFFLSYKLYPLFVITNYLVYLPPTATYPKSIIDLSEIKTLLVDVVVTYKKFTYDEASG